MQWDTVFDQLPLPALFVITLTLTWLSLESGFRVGRWRGRAPDHELEAVVRTEVTVMGGLVTFILAFTFWIAATHFDSTRQALLNEANAIKMTYLRADLLPEPHRGEIRNILREYVDVRMEAIRKGKYDQAISVLEGLHDRLWFQVSSAKEKASSPIFAGYFIQSLNELIALQTRKMVIRLEYRIPTPIWVVLFLIIMIAAASIGCHAGLTRVRRPLVAIMYTLIFSIVILLIADLDNPRRGTLKVSKHALENIRRTIGDPNR